MLAVDGLAWLSGRVLADHLALDYNRGRLDADQTLTVLETVRVLRNFT